MGDTSDVWRGTLAIMALKTLEVMGPLHGYGVARRIEQTSGGLLSVNYGTIYPALLKLEQEGYVSSAWGTSDNNRRAKYYKLTRAGRRRLEEEARERGQAEELESHLGMAVEENVRAGMRPEEARRQAMIQLGGVEEPKERSRSQ